jgi:hypothetical protein
LLWRTQVYFSSLLQRQNPTCQWQERFSDQVPLNTRKNTPDHERFKNRRELIRPQYILACRTRANLFFDHEQQASKSTTLHQVRWFSKLLCKKMYHPAPMLCQVLRELFRVSWIKDRLLPVELCRMIV